MVNFIKAANMSDIDFLIWIADHPQYYPKNPSEDSKLKDVVNANRYFFIFISE